jgi:hypothetical protein
MKVDNICTICEKIYVYNLQAANIDNNINEYEEKIQLTVKVIACIMYYT